MVAASSSGQPGRVWRVRQSTSVRGQYTGTGVPTGVRDAGRGRSPRHRPRLSRTSWTLEPVARTPHRSHTESNYAVCFYATRQTLRVMAIPWSSPAYARSPARGALPTTPLNNQNSKQVCYFSKFLFLFFTRTFPRQNFKLSFG